MHSINNTKICITKKQKITKNRYKNGKNVNNSKTTVKHRRQEKG
jgi:hypothetical protein